MADEIKYKPIGIIHSPFKVLLRYKALCTLTHINYYHQKTMGDLKYNTKDLIIYTFSQFSLLFIIIVRAPMASEMPAL
jgi:hypothetical protein